jgi:TolB-like protein/DNA-binding winged helix-turn-helix (wHTH) protein
MDTASPSQLGAIRFGVFELDLRAGELRKQGVKIKLQEQPFQVLQVLLEKSGEVVTREELRQRIWPSDTFVDFDGGMNNAIKRLREALGDNAGTPRFIETLPRRGYRFIGSVNGHENLGAGSTAVTSLEAQPSKRLRFRGIAIGAAVVLAAGVIILALDVGGIRSRFHLKPNPPPIRSIAVLPLQNLSNDPEQEYFVDGMTEELITDLSQIGGIKVISRTSIMHYKRTEKTLPEIARELNVDGIIEGTVQRSGDRVRITAQLIYAPKDTNVWAGTYDRDLRDVFALQSAVAGVVAGEVRARLTQTEQARLNASRPVNLEAFEAYQQGNYHANRIGRGFGEGEAEKALEYFQRAIAEDPNFAPAYVELVEACFLKQSVGPEACSNLATMAEKAVALDPASSRAHYILGKSKLLEGWDLASAGKEFREAIQLSRNDAQAHDWLGGYLDLTGRFEEGMNEFRLAQELDPANDHLSVALDCRGQYDQAIEIVQKSLELDPNNGWLHYNLLTFYEDKGAYEKYVQEGEKNLRLFGYPDYAARVHRAYVTSGTRGALIQWAKDFEQLNKRGQIDEPVMLAEVYAMLGDRDHAFQWLQKAYEERNAALLYLKFRRIWDPYRSDPRFVAFVALARRTGVP